MNFPSIKQNLGNIDYAWNKPQTYLVVIPGISLLIQKIQLARTLPLINDVTPQNVSQADAKSRHFANICKWHLRGSMVQMLAAALAIKIFAAPVLSFLIILATYEMVDTLAKSLKNSITLYEFHSNGNVKRMTSANACNIF